MAALRPSIPWQSPDADEKQCEASSRSEIKGRPPPDGVGKDARQDETERETKRLAEAQAPKAHVARPPFLDAARDDGDGRGRDDGVGDALQGAEGDELAPRARQAAREGEGGAEGRPDEVHALGAGHVGDGAGQQQARARGEVVARGRPDEEALLQAQRALHGGQGDDDDAVAEAAEEGQAADLDDDEDGSAAREGAGGHRGLARGGAGGRGFWLCARGYFMAFPQWRNQERSRWLEGLQLRGRLRGHDFGGRGWKGIGDEST